MVRQVMSTCSPYLLKLPRPLHIACHQTWKLRGTAPPCGACPVGDICNRERRMVPALLILSKRAMVPAKWRGQSRDWTTIVAVPNQGSDSLAVRPPSTV